MSPQRKDIHKKLLGETRGRERPKKKTGNDEKRNFFPVRKIQVSSNPVPQDLAVN